MRKRPGKRLDDGRKGSEVTTRLKLLWSAVSKMTARPNISIYPESCAKSLDRLDDIGRKIIERQDVEDILPFSHKFS